MFQRVAIALNCIDLSQSDAICGLNLPAWLVSSSVFAWIRASAAFHVAAERQQGVLVARSQVADDQCVGVPRLRPTCAERLQRGQVFVAVKPRDCYP